MKLNKMKLNEMKRNEKKEQKENEKERRKEIHSKKDIEVVIQIEIDLHWMKKLQEVCCLKNRKQEHYDAGRCSSLIYFLNPHYTNFVLFSVVQSTRLL
jgi:hypothetical protein